MKKTIMNMVILISFFLLYGSASATNFGELEENLRILATTPCVRPILILSSEDKINIYITGEMVNSATILAEQNKNKEDSSKYPDLLYIEGGLYFDFKDKEVRKKAIEIINKIISTHEENGKLHQETGKTIPYPETTDSYFWGSLVPGFYTQNYITVSSKPKIETFDNFRFLTMRISVVLPFAKDWSYDATKSDLYIERRLFHSEKRLKLCQDNNLFIGIKDPMSQGLDDGVILSITKPDRYLLSDQNIPKNMLMFKDIINNIVLLITKTKNDLPVRGKTY